MAADPRPNILYIFTDQQSAETMSCAGNEHLNTPAMDSLAYVGVRFDNAYCTFPLCVLSRMSMLTSRMPHELGVYTNIDGGSIQLPRRRWLGNIMSSAGYECHWVGKWHIVGSGDQHGFREVVFGGGYGGLDRDKAKKAAEFIKGNHENPFFLVVSFNNPHDCCEWSRKQKLPTSSGPIPPASPPDRLPPLPENFEMPENEPDYLRTYQKVYARLVFKGSNNSSILKWDEHQFREYLWGYYRLVEKVDAEIGEVLSALRESGLTEKTIIILSSDHGDGHSCHRWNQKISLYDEPARVPFIVAQSGVTKGGHVDNHIVSAGLDLMPTICDYAGVEPPEGCLGRSVRPLAEGRKPRQWRRYVVSETSFITEGANVGEDLWPKARMVRTDRYKYIAYDTGKLRDQLIDMEKDPGEMINLAVELRYGDILDEHRRILCEWCKQTGDTFAKHYAHSM